MTNLGTPAVQGRPSWIKWAVIAGMAVILLASLGGFYNGMVKKRNGVDQQFAQIDVQLQRRYDLIPNVVNSVKGAQQQERDVIAAIADARTRYAGATSTNDKVGASNDLESALSRLLVINEAYPDLKSNTQVQALIAELEGSENRVSQERRKYNDVVTDYNNSIQTFPRNLFAGLFGFEKRDLFVANPSAATAPTVDLTPNATTSSTAAS